MAWVWGRAFLPIIPFWGNKSLLPINRLMRTIPEKVFNPAFVITSEVGCIFNTMRLECVANGIPVGSFEPQKLDASMGVAGGRFEPYPAYARIQPMVRASRDHSQNDLLFVVRPFDGQDISHSGPILILDYLDELGEIRIEVMGIPHPMYEELFL